MRYLFLCLCVALALAACDKSLPEVSSETNVRVETPATDENPSGTAHAVITATAVYSNAETPHSVTVNGVTVNGGNSIVVRDGKIIVDGKDVTPDTKVINITVNGAVEELTADACNQISITGDTRSISTQSGNVRIGGNVNGLVRTMSGNIDAKGTVAGSASSMTGNVNCGK